ncbi:MAG TPA: polysaccharide deacetylase family protein, partial [Candidatus Angelobacter sp.]|nr:polysaccharide deacetylase family protein [Candidatus Angelobacter sp.]
SGGEDCALFECNKTMASPFTRSASRAQGKAFWARLLRASGLLYLARKWVQRHGTIVLTFHRVLTDSELQQTASLGGMIVRHRTFAAFLEYASHACEFADLAQEPDWRAGAKLKLAVTFDDGWSDNAHAAYPIACQHKIPLVIFIVPERTGTALPFWPERTAAALDRSPAANGSRRSAISIEKAIEELKELPARERERRIVQMADSQVATESSAAVDRTMTWDQITELHAGGVIFGSHTSTHEILTVIPTAQAQQEIVSSREVIQQKINAPCSLFSYPNGDASVQVREMVAEAGYKLAFLNQEPGVWTRDCDPYLIPRVNVCEYHLVDSRGEFSPVIFDYAVVWSAAKGLLSRLLSKRLQKFQSARQISDKAWKPTEKKPLEKSS